MIGEIDSLERDAIQKTPEQAQQDANFQSGIKKLNDKNRALVSELIEQLQPIGSVLTNGEIINKR